MEIADIKINLPITTVLAHYNLTPNKNHLLKCPFHNDKTASLQVYPKTNTWHCFGCGAGTDVIDLIQMKDNCSKHEAIVKATSMIPGDPTNPKPIQQPRAMVKTLTPEARTAVFNKAFKYFAQGMKSTKKAQEYLQQRAIDQNSIIVGYDSGMLHRKATKQLKTSYLETNLIKPDSKYRENNYHTFFNGCLIFPKLDRTGNIVSFYGKHIESGIHKNLPGSHEGLYPNWPSLDTTTIIVTECVIDAATLLQHSEITEIYAVLAQYGADIWTPDHTEAIRELHRLKEVIFFFDGDEAGRKGAMLTTEKLHTINPKLKVTYIQPPEGEDINSLAQSHVDQQAELFTHLIDERRSVKPNNILLSSETTQQPTANTSQKVLPTNGHPADPQLGTPISTGKLNTSNPDKIIYKTDELTITLHGGIDCHNIKRLRATLHIRKQNDRYRDYRDTIDLYGNSARKRLIREVAEDLEVPTQQVKQAISDLTNQLEQHRSDQREERRRKEATKKRKDQEVFTQAEMQQGMKLLNNKQLMKRTQDMISNIGLIGQEKNGMLLFFIYITRMFKEPLHALVQGTSGSGKTHLLKKVLSLVPRPHCKSITAITENALYYTLKDTMKHIILLLEDLEGSYSALLPIRELMSNMSISKLTTITNPRTGEPEQKELYVEGPTCVAGATTRDNIYEDNANRSFLIEIQDTPEQTARIMEYQRKQVAGPIDKGTGDAIRTKFKAAQLQLEHLEVTIPFSDQLRIPEHVFKKNRTNKHYLTLIRAIAFWNQKQRKVKQAPDGTRYIEADIEDVWWANHLAREALLRKSDELNSPLRSFFEKLKEHLKEDEQETFVAKAVRSHFRMAPITLNRYLNDLGSRGYIKRTGGNRRSGYEYRIELWDEYEKLQQGLDVLDEIYKQLKEKYTIKKGVKS